MLIYRPDIQTRRQRAFRYCTAVFSLKLENKEVSVPEIEAQESAVQNFVKLIETYIHIRNPGITSLERSPAVRKGKIYLDYLQNAKGKTMASVYSIRPRLGAPVSAPLPLCQEERTSAQKPKPKRQVIKLH